MSQSIVSHTTGTRSTTDTILINGAISTQGSTTLAIDGGTTTATIVQGDVFTIANVFAVNPQTRQTTGSLQQFVCTATSTATAGAWATVSVSPAMYTAGNALATIDAFPADNAAVTFTGSASTAYPQNLLYQKDAITFATADLLLPQGVDMASRQVHNGISMRIVRQYDINNDRMPCRIDVLYGFSVIRPQMAVRMWG
jgi:P22 coat protein - gene protein 5